ncbi:unnamed protein product [Rotaria magnacalcarata]|uniref:Condensation domain-containing protein n=1 Tax=Rotaria magnacalcarata TaxID=392030 RepID=A0A816NIT7_9BILA|nr:unnamed protein product [Rotaria magnacalcarata]
MLYVASSVSCQPANHNETIDRYHFPSTIHIAYNNASSHGAQKRGSFDTNASQTQTNNSQNLGNFRIQSTYSTSTKIGNSNLQYQPSEQRKSASSNQDQHHPKHFKINDNQQQQNPKIDENQEQKQYSQTHENQQQSNENLVDRLTEDETTPRFIDYAIIERELSMGTAYTCWHEALRDFEINRSLLLPFDRRRVYGEHRSGYVTLVSFDFGDNLSQRIILCASENMKSILHIILASYYVFLFKLSNGERDLCVGMNINGRYKSELDSLIGVFVNTIHLQCKIDSHGSFEQLVKIHHDAITGQLSCTPNASIDVFETTTVEQIAQRFLIMMEQLYKQLLQSINSTEVLFSSQYCAHQEFALRAYEHSQEVAAELDDRTLTYGELLYDVHLLALYSLENCDIKSGNIVCQCVERSLSMAIGIMTMEMAAGACCPLSPRDPLQRLYSLVEQTQTPIFPHSLEDVSFIR